MATLENWDTQDGSLRVENVIDGVWKVAQKWTLAAKSTVSEIYMYSNGQSGFNGNISIYSDLSTPVVGLAVNVVAPANGWIGGAVNTPSEINAGDYWIIIENSAAAGTYLDVGIDSSGGYGKDTKKYSGVSWTDEAGVDCAFRIIGTESYVFDPPVPTGLNVMKTLRRLTAAANNRIWYEDI